ncbi:unnamed protein product [Bursaphelenchus okinawaensis]|uniref:Uncharacterized protein n=1 Tax=Bursaphelenchus okinawaensis TaxID=465554 RepID=A0A811LNE3_9BILA|nr:unnamed protein product [Bursaphelenchus okinawaensis]CAG9124733.1 unnamed protein product [Bursaphelenchus okinawaensis]
MIVIYTIWTVGAVLLPGMTVLFAKPDQDTSDSINFYDFYDLNLYYWQQAILTHVMFNTTFFATGCYIIAVVVFLGKKYRGESESRNQFHKRLFFCGLIISFPTLFYDLVTKYHGVPSYLVRHLTARTAGIVVNAVVPIALLITSRMVRNRFHQMFNLNKILPQFSSSALPRGSIQVSTT